MAASSRAQCPSGPLILVSPPPRPSSRPLLPASTRQRADWCFLAFALCVCCHWQRSSRRPQRRAPAPRLATGASRFCSLLHGLPLTSSHPPTRRRSRSALRASRTRSRPISCSSSLPCASSSLSRRPLREVILTERPSRSLSRRQASQPADTRLAATHDRFERLLASVCEAGLCKHDPLSSCAAELGWCGRKERARGGQGAVLGRCDRAADNARR